MKRKISVLLVICLSFAILSTAKTSDAKTITWPWIKSWKGNTVKYITYSGPAENAVESKTKKAKVTKRTKYYYIDYSANKNIKISKSKCKYRLKTDSMAHKMVVKNKVITKLYIGVRVS